MARVPKNGFGGPWACAESAGLFLGDVELDVEPFAVAPALACTNQFSHHQLKRTHHPSTPKGEREKKKLTGGANALALTLGRNDDALALSLLFALVGDIGPAPPFAPAFVWILALAGAAAGVAAGGDDDDDAPSAAGNDEDDGAAAAPLLRFPLNGGMGWIDMMIRPTAFTLPFVSPCFVAPADEAAAVIPADDILFELLGAGVPGLPEEEAAALAPEAFEEIRLMLRLGAGMPPPDAAAAATVLETPMARAWLDSASFVDFSIIWRCFSASLARIGTRSSGIGLLSYKYMHTPITNKQTSSPQVSSDHTTTPEER